MHHVCTPARPPLADVPRLVPVGACRDLLLVPWIVAGVQTQYHHLSACLPPDARVRVVETVPYVEGGCIERLPLPPSIRGTLRSTLTLTRTLRGGRVGAVWSQVALPLLPFTLTPGALRRIPIFYAIDCTPTLLWRFGGHYAQITDPDSPKGRLTAACLRLFFGRCAGLLPWSEWAARSMIGDFGADPRKVHVLPPGIDVRRWTPGRPRSGGGPVRLLFVGGDFERKGGRVLLDLFRTHLRHSCELHIVSRTNLPDEPGVRLHRGLRPDDNELLELYRGSDVLVLPTQADCFSMAALEAMACAVPVVISDVGGIREIVVDGGTGALVQPGDCRALLQAVHALVADAHLRRCWGRSGRNRVLADFNATVQAARTVEIVSRDAPTLGGWSPPS